MDIKDLNVIRYDGAMVPYAWAIERRMENYRNTKERIFQKTRSLRAFTDRYLSLGVHRESDGSVTYREWAPGADRLFFYGDFNGWNRTSHEMKKEDGIFSITLPEGVPFGNGTKYKVLVEKDGKTEEHIPAHAAYVTQDPETAVWSAEFFEDREFQWTDANFRVPDQTLIYECHIGMATEEYRVGTYREFTERVLPFVKENGYTFLQIMAIQEHPYYASFGYQVANFFAPSSRYGVPSDLKALINRAHELGIAVLLDVVHSHVVRNEREGLNRFDGTDTQYFRPAPAGDHPAWGTKLFDYGKTEVLGFLLSNLRYWMEEFHFDGFRFDGVTSMIYRDHGLGESFDCYDKYFSDNTDEEAVTYLMLANDLVREINRSAVTIAEDMSGMPGMCLPVRDGGVGFTYRLAMGTPDLWIRYTKDVRDEDWSVFELANVLSGHRPHEKVIGYAESHDQALVGDQTLMFRMAGSDMYDSMKRYDHTLKVDRAMALHKLIRLATVALSPDGYLNFMGNEFGHPEWIDFPREGNGWSYHYARRQFRLAKDPALKYAQLLAFDRAMIALAKEKKTFDDPIENHWMDDSEKTISVGRGDVLFLLNFHPTESQPSYFAVCGEEAKYRVLFSTDDDMFGGFGRVAHFGTYEAKRGCGGRIGFSIYLPCRTAIVLEKLRENPPENERE